MMGSNDKPQDELFYAFNFDGTLRPPQRPESATHVIGMNCYRSAGKGTSPNASSFRHRPGTRRGAKPNPGRPSDVQKMGGSPRRHGGNLRSRKSPNLSGPDYARDRSLKQPDLTGG